MLMKRVVLVLGENFFFFSTVAAFIDSMSISLTLLVISLSSMRIMSNWLSRLNASEMVL